jgi:hypothetical protein
MPMTRLKWLYRPDLAGKTVPNRHIIRRTAYQAQIQSQKDGKALLIGPVDWHGLLGATGTAY